MQSNDNHDTGFRMQPCAWTSGDSADNGQYGNSGRKGWGHGPARGRERGVILSNSGTAMHRGTSVDLRASSAE